jgi:anti-anti-sigma factor
MAELENTIPDLKIETRSDPDGTIVVAVGGELDSANVGQLRELVAPVIDDPPSCLVFDLAELRFMDSAGIAVLVQVAAEVDEVRVRDPSPIITRLIAVTGLSGVLRIEA